MSDAGIVESDRFGRDGGALSRALAKSFIYQD